MLLSLDINVYFDLFLIAFTALTMTLNISKSHPLSEDTVGFMKIFRIEMVASLELLAMV